MRWLVVEEGDELSISLIASTEEEKAKLYALCNYTIICDYLPEIRQMRQQALSQYKNHDVFI